ncbi:unnamed protein product [Moneuplotes crassus]|uniref:Cysteine dioxygenase n=1 Tax=Euplotes crassus TaxID=5936 RepID=A0AAD2D7C2_EUPCR|nr:unnamed protein product [Moneuplotes crassus]
MLKKGSKLTLPQLWKTLSAGLQEAVSDFEKREFGLDTMSKYDFLSCEEIQQYINYEDEAGKYYRNLIHRDDSIVLKTIIWNRLATTPIHGHSSRGCWVLLTKGELIEKTFIRKDGKVFQTDEAILKPGEITYNHDAIGFHSMENPSKTEQAMTIHCYHPPYDVTSVMDEDGVIKRLPLTYYGEEGVI